MGNFQALGIAQSAIRCGSAIKMHKCIFAALTLQVFVLDEIARSIVYKVAVDGYFDLRGRGGPSRHLHVPFSPLQCKELKRGRVDVAPLKMA